MPPRTNPSSSRYQSQELEIFKYLEKSTFKNKFHLFLWIIPFVAFLIGYLIADSFLHKTSLSAPNVIGKLLSEAVQTLSKHHLGVRLLQQRPDATLPEGTILDQLPKPNQKIRPNQHVFVTVSTRQRSIAAPDFWGKKESDVLASVAKESIDPQIIHIQSAYPAGMCIAQIPHVGQECENKKMVLYISGTKEQKSIMPNLKGSLLSVVEESLRHHDIRAEIFHTYTPSPEHQCANCKIIDQQPVPGAIIDMSKGLQFQFRVADY